MLVYRKRISELEVEFILFPLYCSKVTRTFRLFFENFDFQKLSKIIKFACYLGLMRLLARGEMLFIVNSCGETMSETNRRVIIIVINITRHQELLNSNV